MPIYTYKHDCGIGEQDFFLKENKDSIIISCYNCGRKVTARQIRDKSLKVGEADGVVGILQNEKTNRRVGKN
jgi:hypothetical protein